MGLKSKPLDKVRQDVPVLKEPLVRVNFNVPESMRAEWKIQAVHERRDLSSIIIEAMRLYLSTHKTT